MSAMTSLWKKKSFEIWQGRTRSKYDKEELDTCRTICGKFYGYQTDSLGRKLCIERRTQT